VVRYCGKDCQRSDWARHRGVCTRFCAEEPDPPRRAPVEREAAAWPSLADETLPAIIQHIRASPGWLRILTCLVSHTDRMAHNYVTMHFVTHLGELAGGATCKYWTLAVVFLREWRSFHLFLSDHDDGIHKRIGRRGYSCSNKNILGRLDDELRLPDGILICCPDAEPPLYMKVDFQTGDCLEHVPDRELRRGFEFRSQ